MVLVVKLRLELIKHILGCEIGKSRVIGLIRLVRSDGLLPLLLAFFISSSLGVCLLQK